MISYKMFKEFLNKGECQTIDFKILSNAFIKGNEEANAELIKDIIALANNGNVSSYLIIGVSNDIKGFKSVENDKFTDDNVQVLCKDSIHPVPKIKVINCYWNQNVCEEHKGKKFVIIQVGPQARQCFRFNRDFIDYSRRYCFRKNEVWIRRGATSDLATPEEIKRLVEGKAFADKPMMEDNIQYNRLPEDRHTFALGVDLATILSEVKGTFSSGNQNLLFFDHYLCRNDWKLITLNINQMKLKLVVTYLKKCNTKGTIAQVCRTIPILHHGVLIICDDGISASSAEWCPIKIKESWGYFCTNSYTVLGSLINELPIKEQKRVYKENDTFCICLGNIKSTQDLYDNFFKMLDSLNEEKDLQNYIKDIFNYINKSFTKLSKVDDEKSIAYYERAYGTIVTSKSKIIDAFNVFREN